MPGAIIAIDQDRPGGSTSFGTPGVARNDLWQSRTIRPRSTQSGNLSQQWTLLDAPPTSTAVLNNSTSTTCDFTPDLPGSYRIQLVTNGGGSGNIQILVARVRFDVSGTLTNRGYALPAFGELPPEANYGGNTRGWDEVWEFIIGDILAFIAGGGGGFTAGTDLAGNTTNQTVIGWDGHPLDPSSFGTPSDGHLPIWNSSGHWFAVAMSGDATLTNAGALQVTKLGVLAGGGNGLVSVDNTGTLFLQTVAPIVAGIHTGTATLDFGSAPGTTTARVTVSGQSGLLAGSTPKAWVMYKDSADNTKEEHLAARIYVIAGNISGTSFDIAAMAEGPLVGTFNVGWEWY